MTDEGRIPLEDVALVVNSLTKNTVKRAIILMMYSSGLSLKEIKNLTKSDLIKACGYIVGNKNINDLIRHDPIVEEMIPMWDVSNEKTKKLVFGSPQSLSFIFQHLTERQDNDEHLFVKENGTPLDKKYLSNWLSPKFRSKITATNNDGNPNFTGKKLSNSFIKLCESNPPKHINQDVIIKIFEGSETSKAKTFYEKMLNDNEIILNYYKSLLPHLTIDLNLNNDGELSISDDITSNATHKSKIYSQDEIRQILKDYYMKHLNKDSPMDYDKYNYMMNLTYRIAIYQNDEFGSFNEDDYLKTLFLKAQIHWLFHIHQHDIEIKYCPNDNQEDIFNKVYDVIEDVGVLSWVPINYELFKEYFFAHPDIHIGHYYGECTRITLSVIGNLVASYVM